MSAFPEITAQELGETLKSDAEFILLDVREAEEWALAKISDSRVRFVPMSGLARLGIQALPAEVRAGSVPVYVLCHHGIRSAQTTRWLRQMGLTQAVNVRGGIDAYARRVDSSVGFY